MKPKNLFKGILALFLLLFAAVGCERDLTVDCSDAEFSVLNGDDTPVTTRQTLNFNTSASLKLQARNIASTEASVPEGWGCEVDIPKRAVTVTAPDGAYKDAALDGDIVITAKGVNGSLVRVTVPVEAVDAEVVLKCTDDLAEPVSLAYGESAELTFDARNVERIDMSDLPAGWKAVRDGFVLTITAPAADDDTAAEEGEIELTPYSRRGSKGASVIIKVAVAEAPIVLTCNEDIGDVIPFRLSDKKVFTFTASQNVVDVNVSDAPKGWTLKPDLEKLSLEISVPDQAPADLAAEGSVVLTPISNRGTEGDPVTIRMQVSITAPVLEFDVTSQYFGLGEMVTIHVAKAINVADVGLKSAPEGWTAAPDFGSQTCALTAPATVSGAASSGKFVFTATSASQETQEVEVEVKFNGLHDAGDFVKFGDAVAAGASIDDFLLGGEVNLFADADLSQAGRDVIVGAAGKPFSGIFNGNGHTITLRIAASGADAGLFHTLGAGAVVRDLKLAGTITSSASDANVGGVAVYNDGAELNGIASSVAFTYNASVNGGYYGGLVAYTRQSGAKYIDCHTTGAVVTKGIKYLGGLLGAVAPDTEGTMTDCSNAGSIVLNYGALGMGGGHAAGCVGNTEKSKWTFTRVSNSGNIDYNFGKTNGAIYSIGGAFGMACGKFEECFNTGNVVDTDGADAVAGTRRIGGFAGASASGGYPIRAFSCYNTGKVVGISNYVGGFMGIAEGSKPALNAPNEFTDCYNAGDVLVVSNTTISGMFGGFLAVSYQCSNLTRCSNRGKVLGFTNRSAGGLIGAGADQLVIDQCENTGMVYIGCTVASNPKAGRPFVAGLVAIRGTNPVTIRNSKNTGAVTAMVQAAADVASAYVSEIVTVDGKPDVTVCDDATKTASAGAAVTAILKDNWNSNIPGL